MCQILHVGACFACQWGYKARDVFGQLVGWGSYACNKGSKWNIRLVDLGEAIDPGGLAASRSKLIVHLLSDLTIFF